jgi:hypothetical protein
MSTGIWLVLAGGAVLIVGWIALCAKRDWIPNWREKKRQQEVLARGRRSG